MCQQHPVRRVGRQGDPVARPDGPGEQADGEELDHGQCVRMERAALGQLAEHERVSGVESGREERGREREQRELVLLHPTHQRERRHARQGKHDACPDPARHPALEEEERQDRRDHDTAPDGEPRHGRRQAVQRDGLDRLPDPERDPQNDPVDPRPS
jgi:hypothetical protein